MTGKRVGICAYECQTEPNRIASPTSGVMLFLPMIAHLHNFGGVAEMEKGPPSPEYVYRHHFKMFPVGENSNLLGCISIDNIRQMPKGDWQNRTVRELMEPRSKSNTVSSDTETTSLLSAMVQPGQQFTAILKDSVSHSIPRNITYIKDSATKWTFPYGILLTWLAKQLVSSRISTITTTEAA